MFGRAGAGQRALSRYAGLLEHAVGAPHSSERLASVRKRLSDGERLAPACMRQLNRIIGFAELRSGAGIFHFLIQALTLWDFHVAFALDRWRGRVGRHVRPWIQASGELDALSSLANVARDNPSWCTPQFHSAKELVAVDLGHPLLPDDRRIPNDVEIGPPGSVLLITGSNMSGKSTLLRAVGMNVVLAQAGAPACATSLRLPLCDLQASLRVQDSLELGLSYFMAALARLKGIVDAAEHERGNRVLLYLLDEILQGTNSVERSVAVRGVVRHLIEDDARSLRRVAAAPGSGGAAGALHRSGRRRRKDVIRLSAAPGSRHLPERITVDANDRNQPCPRRADIAGTELASPSVRRHRDETNLWHSCDGNRLRSWSVVVGQTAQYGRA
jgi:hypothetical protein